MSLLTRFLAAYYRTGLRGSTRLIDVLSKKMRSLHNVPIRIEGGTLYADLRIPTTRSLLANPQCESGEDIVMRKFIRNGDVVFDIGAHLGFYTLLMSHLTGNLGTVVAFEPNPELLPSLRRNIAENSNVRLLEIALSDTEGTMDLYVPEDASMASLSDWTHGVAGVVHTVSCSMKRLDDLIDRGELPIPHFIKCDVEGAELSVFHGGIKTLNRANAPVILFEANAKAAGAFGNDPAAYFKFLGSLEHPRFRYFEVRADGLHELSSTALEYANVVAVPENRI